MDLAPGGAPPPDVSPFMQLQIATARSWLAPILDLARQTGALDILGGPQPFTEEQLVAETLLNPKGAFALSRLLVAHEVLAPEPEDGGYSLTPLGTALISGDPGNQGLELLGSPFPRLRQDVTFDLQAVCYLLEPRDELAGSRDRRLGVLRRQMAGRVSEAEVTGDFRSDNRQLRNRIPCQRVVSSGHLDACQRVLDVGGGTGVFAIPLHLRTGARVHLLEVGVSCELARTAIVEAGVEAGVEVLCGDLWKTPWPDRMDAVFMGNLVHVWGDEQVVRVLQMGRDCLSDGGHVYLHEQLWNPTRTGPLTVAFSNLVMQGGTPGGRQRTLEELRACMANAGLELTGCWPTDGHFSLLQARAPDR